jgi:hypothetical protein
VFQSIKINTNVYFFKNKSRDLLLVKKSELEIWSLQIPNFQRIQARNCVLAAFHHHDSTQRG